MSYAALALAPICAALLETDVEATKRLARADFPFAFDRPLHHLKRPPVLPQVVATARRIKSPERPVLHSRLFARDGFVDRYSGDELVYPPALRLLSLLLPNEFPFHSNWKRGIGHTMYWSLSATCDHVIPLARGGPDTEENWFTCSELTNEKKSYWLLEELGWELHPPGILVEWDGLLNWFMQYLDRHPAALLPTAPSHLQVKHVEHINPWKPAAQEVLRYL